MSHVEMSRRIREFIKSWGKELEPKDRAPAPLTKWLAELEAEG